MIHFQSTQHNASFQLILDTAEQLIQEKGCRKTTLQDIIDRSGLSKGAIYHYVSGKDELFGLILKERMAGMDQSFYEAAKVQANTSITNPLQAIALGAFQNTGFDSVTNKIFIYLLGQMDNPKVAAIVQDIYQFAIQTGEKWIQFGQEHGVIPSSVDSEKLSLIFVTFMYGLRVQNMILQGESKLNTEDIFQVMFRSLQ
jgi:AcrR family transcriptional regulator